MKRIILLLFLFFCGIPIEKVCAQYFLATENRQLNKADSLYQVGESKEALAIYQFMLEDENLKKGSKNWIISVLGKGTLFLELEKADEALKLFSEAAEFKDEVDNPELLVYINYKLASGYKAVRNFEMAERELNAGLKNMESANRDIRKAQLLLEFANLKLFEGEMEKASNRSSEALEIFREIDNKYWITRALLEFAAAHLFINRTDLSKDAYLEAIKLSESLGNDRLLSTSLIDYAEMLKVGGLYNEALIYYQKAYGLLKNSGSVLKISRVLNDIGAVYSFLGDGSSAIDFYNRSMEEREKAGLDSNPLTIMNIALVQHSFSEFEKAEEKYFQALEAFERNNRFYWVTRLNEYIADLYIELNDLDKALIYAKKSVEVMESQNDVSLETSSYVILARVYSALGSHNEALTYYRKAYQALGDTQGRSLITSLINLSEAFYNVKSDSAFYYAEKSFDEIEWLRGNIYGDRLQTELFRYFATFFFQVASWELEMNNNIDRAFEIVEMGKSRSLLDQIAGSESLENFVDEASSIQILQKGKELDQLHRKLESASNNKEKKDYKEQIADTKLEYEVLINEVRRNNPDFKRLESPKVVSIRELQKKLDKETVFVEYGSFDNKLIILMISSNSKDYVVREVEEGSSRRYLSRRINSFRRVIQEGLQIDSASKDMHELYSLLIEPVAKRFKNAKNLLIVPDVSLSYLPFEALKSDKNKFLIEDYNIKYIPSGSLLKYIPEPHRDTEMDVLAVAGSGFQTGSTSQKVQSQNDFVSLPSTLLEVDSIATKFENATKLKNEDVSEAGIKKIDLSKYRILHFATHGTVNEDDPSQSGLLLSKRNEMEGLFGEDGLLNSAEISLLNLNADLVVLSACNTGYGRNVVGEGLLGLQRSFLKAGASSVMVSLWSVYDKSTALMMADFYEKMNDYEKKELGLWSKTLIWLELYEAPVFGYKEKALRDAKLAMLEHPYYNHPVNWAPFVLIGK